MSTISNRHGPLQDQRDDSASEQIQQAFHDFDVQKKGYLTLEDLEAFCRSTLGMEKDQVPSLFTQLDQDRDGKVIFEDFRDHWQGITQQSGVEDQLGVDAATPRLLLSPDSDEDDVNEVKPKYVINKKRFGRRSRPENESNGAEKDTPMDTPKRPTDIGSPDLASQIGSIRSNSLLARFGLGDTGSSSPLIQKRTFSISCENDGSPILNRRSGINSPASVTQCQDFVFTDDKDRSVSWDPNSHYTMSAQSPTGDELSMIKTVFDTYDVDHDGLINKQDLSEVCDSLGMSQTEEQLSQLFDMLDEDRDGQVSLDDFCKKLTVVKETYELELESPTAASQALLFEVATSTPLSGHGQSRVPTPAFIGTSLLAKKSAVVEDLFHRLDTNQKGLVQRDALISMWMEQSGDPHNEQHQQITRFLQGLETDENGHVSVEEVTFGMQAALMNDQGHDVRDPVLRIYMTGIRHLRNRLVTVQLEHDKLQADFTALSEQKAQLVRMSDEEAEQLRHEHRHELQNNETKFQEKMQQLEREHRHEQEMVEQQAQKQIRQLEEEIENMKLADDNMKLKIKDLDNDKQLLEKELQQSNSDREELEHAIEHLQRELDNQEAIHSTHDLDSALDDSEQGGVKEELQLQLTNLLKENSKLRDRIDEHVAEIGLYKQQILQERRKSQRENRHRRPSGGSASSIRRTGSKVGDYMKKRKDGVTGSTSGDDTSRPISRDDGVVVSPTPPPVIERSSADGDSSEDDVVVRQHDDEEDDEDDVEMLIAKYVERIKELESEKCHVEDGFQEVLEKKTADLQQENQQLITDKENLVAAKNKLVAQALAFQTTAEASASAHSEMQSMVIERQELRLKARQLEMKLTNAEETNQGLKLENEELKAMTQELRADSNQFLLDIDKLEKENHRIKLQHSADMREEQETLTKQFNLAASKLQQETEKLHADMHSLRNEHAEELQRQKEQFSEESTKVRQKAIEESKAQIDELQSSLREMRVKNEQLDLEVVSLLQENHKISELQHKSENLQADMCSLKTENEDKLQKQKEQFDEERKALELNMSEVHGRSLHKAEEVHRQVTEECKSQIAELQCSLEHMRVVNSELELNLSGLTEEKVQLNTSLCEVSDTRDELEKEKHNLVDSLAEVRQQVAILTRKNEALQNQMEVTMNMGEKQHTQLENRLSELEVQRGNVMKDRDQLEETLADVQDSLSSVTKEKDHWETQAKILEQTVVERDQVVRDLEQHVAVDIKMEAEVAKLHQENTRLQTELKEQSEYAIHLQTILGQYSAEATEQRLLQEAGRKQRLEQLEEENKALHREITPLRRQQNLRRFTSPRPEREIEGLKLENSALTRAMTKSDKNERELEMKCRKLTEQKQALLKLLSRVSLSSVH